MWPKKVPKMCAMAVDFPVVPYHPNRVPFEGVLTFVDTPSDGSPSGARGHKVILTRKAAEESIPSLMGMAVDFRPDWDGHDARNKCGIITSAHLEENRLHVEGFLYSRDFPEMSKRAFSRYGKMGMSYEIADAHVVDMRSPVWTLTRVTFTGAAILLGEKAAYRGTSFRLKA